MARRRPMASRSRSRSRSRPRFRWRRWLLAILLLPIAFWILTLMLWRVVLPPATPLMVCPSDAMMIWVPLYVRLPTFCDANDVSDQVPG